MKDDFTFKIGPVEAQIIFDALECFREELRENKQDWKHTGWAEQKDRLRLNKAVTRYARQLNAQYASTGIEVWGDEILRTK